MKTPAIRDDIELEEVVHHLKQRGRPPDPVISKLAIRYREKQTDSPYWKCVGSRQYVPKAGPCSHLRPGNADRARILLHAKTCSSLPDDLRRFANDCAADIALGNQVTQDSEASHTLQKGNLKASSSTSQSKAQPSITASANLSSDTTSKSSTQLAVTRPGTLAYDFTKRSKPQVEKEVNFRIMKLVCCRGVPPSVIGTPEFRELISFCCSGGPNRAYQPISPDHLTKKLIANEASLVRRRVKDLLKQEWNLTLSFDGHTTRKPQSIYTVHITTMDRHTYFWNGYEDSDKSHNAEYVKSIISQVMNISFSPKVRCSQMITLLGRLLMILAVQVDLHVLSQMIREMLSVEATAAT